MNLFVASMVTLLLADNLLLLYLGWEGVGLCSYLLIGFWYQDPANGLAARKAFIVTRVGDTAMIDRTVFAVHALGHAAYPGTDAPRCRAVAGGIRRTRSRLRLCCWAARWEIGAASVADLAARRHGRPHADQRSDPRRDDGDCRRLSDRAHACAFHAGAAVQFAVAVIGAATLLLAGFSALTQRDIKRVLAYSTISQIGYMFLALGVGAWRPLSSTS